MTKQEMKEKLLREERIIDGHTHVGISPAFYHQYGYPYALSFEDLVIRMEALGIDHSVVFPFVHSAFYELDSQSSQVKTTLRYCNFPYELENRNLLNEIYEIFSEHSQKAIPFLMFDPSRKTKEQAEYLEELSTEYPVFGLKTATTYIQAFVNDLEKKGKPILDFARKMQLPIVFHSAVNPADPWASVYDIIEFAERKVSNKVIELPGGFLVKREYNYLIFAHNEKQGCVNERLEKSLEIKVPGKTQFGNHKIEAVVKQKSSTDKLKTQNSKLKTIELFDMDKIKLPLKVRFRQDGDKFMPLGLTKEKKIGKFLTNCRVPQRIRKQALVVTDTEKIIWLWPIRIAEQAKVTHETQRILQLKII